MQDLSTDDTQHIGEPPQGSDTQGSMSRTRKKRGIVSNNSTFWDKGIVPYVYDDKLGKLFMFVHVCVDCFLFVFVFKSVWLSIPTFETVCLYVLAPFFSLSLSVSGFAMCSVHKQ